MTLFLIIYKNKHQLIRLNGLFNISGFAALIIISVLSGCAGISGNKGEIPFWPKPPDAPRFIYEASLRSESSVIKQTGQELFRQALVGADTKTLIAYEKPFDIAARNGRVVVSDTMTNTLVMFDLTRNRLIRIGYLEYGKLGNPFGVAMDHLLNIYVADESNRHIKIYDDVGFYLGSVGSSEHLVRPIDVAVNPTGDRIYVVDSGGIASIEHRIVVFDGERNKIKVIGTRGSGDGQFNLPVQAAVAPDGTLYVLDAGNFRIQAFDRDGNFLRKWGKVGRTIGDFARPRGIAVDDEGNIYVTDASYRNFQIFNSQGKLLMWVGDSGLENRPGQYAMPAGIAVDETNRIYVVDQLHRKIEVIRRVTEDESKKLALKYRRKYQSATSKKPQVSGQSFSATSLEKSLDGISPNTIIPTEAEQAEILKELAQKKNNDSEAIKTDVAPESVPVPTSQDKPGQENSSAVEPANVGPEIEKSVSQ